MWYDVRYRAISYRQIQSGVSEQYHRLGWCKTPASSKAEALETFGKHSYSIVTDEKWESLFVRELKHEWDTGDKGYWYDKWREAMAAMPVKIMQHKHENWTVVPKGNTRLPEFIERRAKGTMQIVEGVILEKSVSYTSHEYGRASALGILLGYITWTGADHKRKRANSCAMLGRKIPESSRPRSAQARELLSKLGTMDQDTIRQMLDEKRRQMNE